MTSLVVRKVISTGVLKIERVQVICPACGQQVEAVAKIKKKGALWKLKKLV